MIGKERIEALVALLTGKSDSEVEKTFEALGIPSEERTEVLRRLIESRVLLGFEQLSPEELRHSEHFQQLVALTRQGKVILFVGTGISVEAGMPSTGQLSDVLRAEAKGWGIEDLPSDISLPEAARVVEDVIGRPELADLLRRAFDGVLKAEPPHFRWGCYRLLAALPKQLTRVVVTTNWDSLLRRAFEHAGESVIEIVEGAQLAQISLAEHAIVKLLGGFENPDGMGITEPDYAIAAAQISRRTAGTLWGYVASLLSQYSFVFVGYSRQDPDFRLVQRMVEIGAGARPAPHFFVVPLSRLDEEAVSQWPGVRPIPATATDFMLALFQELDEFADRQDELELALGHPHSSFVEFYGPFGSGKTALLDAAERRAQAEGWSLHQIARVNWDRRRDGTARDPVRNRAKIIQILNEDLGPPRLLKRFTDFRDYLHEKAGVFLILDATERVQNQEDLMSLLVDVAAPVIQEMNEQGQRSRLLLAGRYPLQRWPYSFRQGLLSCALTPFDASVVREMAQKFLLATDPDSQERFEPELIANILEVSSGHASFVKAVLMDLMSEGRRYEGRIRLPPHLTEEEKRGYVSRFNEEIDRHVFWGDETLKETYEGTLCVFRRLNREVVRGLDLSFDPFLRLAAIYVLSPRDFSNDQVIRCTKMLRLRYEQPGEFMQAHERAQAIFAAGIERLIYPLQLDYIVEWLFHTAHLLIAEEPEDVKGRFGKLIEQYVRYRSHPERVWGEEVGVQLVRRITDEDRELWNLLEKCAGKEGIEEILAILERKEVLDVG